MGKKNYLIHDLIFIITYVQVYVPSAAENLKKVIKTYYTSSKL